MKITDIKQQVKNQSRYSVYVDQKYSFSLSESGLITAGLHTGQEFTKQELDSLKDTAARDKAYMRSLAYVARRPRSEWEMRDYLRRKEYDEPVAGEVVAKLKGLNLLDDRAFAASWVQSRRLLKPVSKRRLVQELRQKRVANDIIDAVLAEDKADDRSVLLDLIERKRRQAKYHDDQKLMQYLARQGFNFDDIKDALQGNS
jgi:regulatory protein